MSSLWVTDRTFEHRKGDVLFLAEELDGNTGKARWRVSPVPFRTNISREVRLSGWCGETNNKTITAHGAVRVVTVARASDDYQRLRLARATPAEVKAALKRELDKP